MPMEFKTCDSPIRPLMCNKNNDDVDKNEYANIDSSSSNQPQQHK